MNSVSGYTAPMFTITLQLPPQQNTPSSSEQQAVVPQQIGVKLYTAGNAPGTASATFNYGTNRTSSSNQLSSLSLSNTSSADKTYTPSSPSLSKTSSADKSAPASSLTPSNSANCSAEVTKQSTTHSEILKTGIGGKSMTSASAYEKQIDDSRKDADEYSQRLLDLRSNLAELGKSISHFLRTGSSENSKEILNARAEFARIEQEVKTCEEKLAQAKKQERTAIANRNNALDGVGRESTQAPSNFLQNILQRLANAIASFFGMGNNQNKSTLDVDGNQNKSLLETVIGGGNYLAAQEYDKDIEKARQQLSGYEKDLKDIQDQKSEIDTFVSDSLRNKGLPEKHLDILEAREKWDALIKRENELKERIATTKENIQTFETRRDAQLNANVANNATAHAGNATLPNAPTNPFNSNPSNNAPFSSNPSKGHDLLKDMSTSTNPFLLDSFAKYTKLTSSTARF